jgi:hypothetical protein
LFRLQVPGGKRQTVTGMPISLQPWSKSRKWRSRSSVEITAGQLWG